MRGRWGATLRKSCLAVLAAGVGLAPSGCSLIFSQGPPADHRDRPHVECSDSFVPPLLDAAPAVLMAIGALASSNNEANPIPALVMAGLLGGSATYGFGAARSCEKAQHALIERWAEAQRVLTPKTKEPVPPAVGWRPEDGAQDNTQDKRQDKTAAGATAGAPNDPLLAARSPDPYQRMQSASQLAAQQTVTAHAALSLLATRDPEPAVREAAIMAIAHSRNAGLMDLVQKASVFDPDPTVRARAAEAQQALFPFTRRVGMATGLSLLPGGGHFYLGRPGAGAAYLGSIVGLAAGGIALAANDNPVDDSVSSWALLTAQNVWFFSIFDAYRSARLARDNHGYDLPVSDETLGALIAAPFSPSVLKSPWVWAGVPAFLASGFALIHLSDRNAFRGGPALFKRRAVQFLGRNYHPVSGAALGELYFAANYMPVGVGEEAFFRGFVQPALSESFGPWGGWAGASAIFGAAHIFNFTDGNADLTTALVALPFITAAGAYMGLVSMQHGYTLSRSVAIHFWYDFLLTTVGFIYDPDNQPFVARFGSAF